MKDCVPDEASAGEKGISRQEPGDCQHRPSVLGLALRCHPCRPSDYRTLADFSVLKLLGQNLGSKFKEISHLFIVRFVTPSEVLSSLKLRESPEELS